MLSQNSGQFVIGSDLVSILEMGIRLCGVILETRQEGESFDVLVPYYMYANAYDSWILRFVN